MGKYDSIIKKENSNRYKEDEFFSFGNVKFPKEKDDIVYIYELIDPRDLQPNYIGYTDDPKQRIIEHLNVDSGNVNKYTKNKNWIRSLLEIGLTPLMNILDEVPEENWPFWEGFWEDTFRGWGFELRNTVKCGRGTRGFKRPKPEWERKKHSETLKEGYASGRIKNPNKGVPMSEKQRQNLKVNTSFHHITPEQIEKRRQTNLSRKHKRTPEQKERRSLGQLKKYISKPNYRCFVQLSDDNKVLGMFVTLKEACTCVYEGAKQSSGILVAIRDSKKCMGYRWRYGTESETLELLKEKFI